jgi:hypothetical protein
VTRREQAVVGLCLAGAVAVGGHLGVVEPLLTRHREATELTPAREAALARRHLLLASRERLATELAATVAHVESMATRLLPGPTAPVAAAELQRLVKVMAVEANADVRSERVLPAAELGGVQEIGVELTVSGTIRETMAFLHRVEGASRLLTVKDVKIRLVASGQPRDLLTTLVVSGYLRTGPTEQKAGEALGPAGST